MKRIMKKGIAAALCLAMTLTAVGCGGSGSRDQQGSSQSGLSGTLVDKEHVYSESSFEKMDEFLGDNGYVGKLVLQDDIIYMMSEHSLDNGYSDHFSTWDLEGNQLTDVEFYVYQWMDDAAVSELDSEEAAGESEDGNTETAEDGSAETAGAGTAEDGSVDTAGAGTTGTAEDGSTETSGSETAGTSGDSDSVTTAPETDDEAPSDLNQDTYINGYWISPEGNLYYLMEIYAYNDEWTYTENYTILAGIQSDGTELFHLRTSEWGEEYDYAYFSSMDFSQGGQLVLIGYQYILVLDPEGNLVSAVEKDRSLNYYIQSFSCNGMPVCLVWNDDYTEASYRIFDLTTGEPGEELVLPEIINNYELFDGEGSGYDLLAVDSAGIYGCNFGDEELTQIMDFVASDVAAMSMSNIAFLSEDTFLGVYYDIVNYENHLCVFTHVDPETVPDRIEISLAMYYANNEIVEKVIDFNKSSEEYKIVVTYYSSYATDEDYLAGGTKLSNEIVSGDIPDIIYDYRGNYFDLDAYGDLGVLADFYELIEADPELDLEDYCQNVFEAYEDGGSLYQLPISFRIETVMGKTSIFGEEALTWEKLFQVMEEYPGASVFGEEVTREDILSAALEFSYSEFVDEESGTCDFTGDSFQSLLEFAAQYPEEIDYDALYNSDDYWQNYESRYITDQVLLSGTYISSVENIRYDYYYEFTEEASAVGFPNNSGIRGALTDGGTFAISRSGNVDGAWEFVRSFITEEGQSVDSGNFDYKIPVLKSSVEALAQQMTRKPHYFDDEEVEYDYVIYIGDAEITVDPATEEEAAKWVDFIYSVNTRANNTTAEVADIIYEEAGAYFSGQKTIDEVCQIIQSRMSIYISENE
ncbi:MAG: hypothetical protein LUC90_08125 [Lachnospiraceae bacterium]|nr:hypothetical protein [Lachnospiraceae bacterium]